MVNAKQETASHDDGNALRDDIGHCAVRIDEIDSAILGLLSDRFRYSRHIGKLKADRRLAPFDPQRVSSQKAGFVEQSRHLGLDPAMARAIIDAVLARVLAERRGAQPHENRHQVSRRERDAVIKERVSMDFGLNGRNVVIVGGNRGIGLEIAKGFLGQGAAVTITSEHESVFAALDQLKAVPGAKAEALQFDITSREAVTDAFAKLGPIDVLINNSGVFWDTPSDDRSERNYDVFVRQTMINVVGNWWCTMEAVPHMSDGGRIIFTASISGKRGSPRHAGYAATKHGVLGMVKCLAMDLGPLGISVNAVCPGSSATETNLVSLPEDRQRAAVANMALHPGLLDPGDHVGSYLFLASDAAAHITGQTITVDRGQTCI